MSSNTTNWVIIGAVAIVLVLGGVWLMQRSTDESIDTGTPTTGTNTGGNGTTPTTTGTGTTPITTGAKGEKITVDNQAAGISVRIASMNLTRETWVAVRDERSILGAGRFAAGTASGSVELLRGTEAGKSYSVVVYIDNGNRAFDLTGDELVTGVSDTFMATAAATSTQ
ncbi:MAG TPA: hypothetical protein VJL39_00310 [Candidatus Paceibacterota bacterium]